MAASFRDNDVSNTTARATHRREPPRRPAQAARNEQTELKSSLEGQIRGYRSRAAHRAIRSWMGTSLRVCLRAWAWYVVLSHERSAMVGRHVRQSMRRFRARCFVAWRDLFFDEKKQHRLLVRVVARMQARHRELLTHA